ncbi:hypothetical protein RAN3_2688 [plant metagenome]|uniref:Uncharacterized protein n=1 Tax=plant metagenome TaxID=1297885 RepID=A0A484VCQ3_9ZZZZ
MYVGEVIFGRHGEEQGIGDGRVVPGYPAIWIVGSDHG